MSVSTQDGRGAALQNKASKILDVTESTGPVTLVVVNEGPSPIVVSVKNSATGKRVATDDEVAVVAEATGYVGNTVLLSFTGQNLNVLPIIPGSVTIKPTAGGNSVNAVDKNGDGNLYATVAPLDLVGTIDYLTGALRLVYPAGRAPNTGAINADYSHATKSQVARGNRTLRVSNNPPLKDLTVSAAGLGGDSVAQITAVVPF